MGVQNLTLQAPADGLGDWPLRELRPPFYARWENNGAGGTVDYTVLHEWDTDPGFASGALITDSNTTPDAATFADLGIPPSDMGPDGTLWYYQFTVTDNDDAGSLTLATAATITFEDAIHHRRHLGIPISVQPDFVSGGVDDPIESRRHLFLPVNVIPGWEPGQADERLAHDRFLYSPVEVTTDVPVPYITEIIPTTVEVGDALIVRGWGFDNAARAWSSVVRLYDNPDPLAAGASFVVLTELSFTEGSPLDEFVVQIPGGATSGWVVVKNEA